MARMFPSEIPSSAPASEKFVLETLCEQLSDDYSIIWSIKTLSMDESARIVLGEADIVILHPKRGLLVLEVKGGSIRYDPVNNCYRSQDSYGQQHTIKDPYDQAFGRAIDLSNRIHSLGICGKPGNGIPCIWGHGVVFPDCTISATDVLPPNALREVTLDSNDLTFLGRRIDSIYHHWANGREWNPLSPNEYRAILHKALMPEFNLAFALTAELRDGGSRILRLTDEQCGKLEVFEDEPRALVKGAAGTGKTIVLLEFARRLASSGKSVLILCYNRPLCEHLQHRVEKEDMGVDVATFHHLCRMVIENAGESFDAPADSDSDQFWKVDAPNRMYELLDQYPKRWDAVLVDEGQDFDAAWWTCVESVLSSDSGIFHIYYDPCQSIYSVQNGLPFQEPDYTLKTNCRNTKNICRLLHSITPEYDPRVPASSPVGRIPHFIQIPEGQNSLQAIDRLVDQLVVKERIRPSQIVILSPHRQQHSSLCARTNAGRSNLVDSMHFGEDAVTYCTIPRFKGLESEVVIVIDIKAGDPACNNRQLHTAYSRAKQLLYVLHDTSYMPPALEWEPDSLQSPSP